MTRPVCKPCSGVEKKSHSFPAGKPEWRTGPELTPLAPHQQAGDAEHAQHGGRRFRNGLQAFRDAGKRASWDREKTSGTVFSVSREPEKALPSPESATASSPAASVPPSGFLSGETGVSLSSDGLELASLSGRLGLSWLAANPFPLPGGLRKILRRRHGKPSRRTRGRTRPPAPRTSSQWGI